MTPNERIANEIMGWKEVGMGYFQYSNSPLDAKFPSFDLNLNECHLMEEKIKEKGWDGKYFHALTLVIAPSLNSGRGTEIFKLVHASAKERTEAAMRMLDEMKEIK